MYLFKILCQKETTYISDAILIIISLLIINEILLNKLSQLKQKYPQLEFINNTFITTLLGIVVGISLHSSKQIVLQIKDGFSQIFLILLLPPILFQSSIDMDTVTFFEHFGTINLYAILGTIISMVITSFMMFASGILDLAITLPISVCFAYGAIISSTDPVAVLGAFKEMKQSKMMYTFIFGESILNDAVALTLFQSVIQIETQSNTDLMSIGRTFVWVFLASIFIGYILGILSAIILKSKFESFENFELSLMLLIPWVTYLIAEALEMSGIVSIVFCGIAMSRYAIPHLSEDAAKNFKHFYEILAYIFENAVFLLIGIGLIGFELLWKQTGIGLIIVVLLAILVSRFANVFLITKLANHFRSTHRINNTQLFLLWFSGLRGAMAYALALQSCIIYKKDNIGSILLTVTLVIIMFNIFQGLLLTPVLNYFKVELTENYIENSQLQPQEKNMFKRFKEFVSRIDLLFIHVFLQKTNDEQLPNDITEHYYNGRQENINE